MNCGDYFPLVLFLEIRDLARQHQLSLSGNSSTLYKLSF